MKEDNVINIIKLVVLVTSSVFLVKPSLVNGDNLALLSGTLRSYQKAACDGDWVELKCPEHTTISIQLARYGATPLSERTLCRADSVGSDRIDEKAYGAFNFSARQPQPGDCFWHSTIQAVVGLCQKKNSCYFHTAPATFGGDPCPGRRKFVEIAYKCRPSEFRSAIACENDVIELICNKSSRLAIYSARYGRTEYESVQCPQPPGVQEQTCLSSHGTETVMHMCHGKRRCALGANSASFGNPCRPKSRTYLKVIYTCVPRSVLKQQFQGGTEPDEKEDQIQEIATSKKPVYFASYPIHEVTMKTTPSTTTEKSTNEEVTLEDYVRSSAVLNADGDFRHHDGTSNNTSQSSDFKFVYLISEGVQAYNFIKNNPRKFVMFLVITSAATLIVFVVLIVMVVCVHRKCSRGQQSSTGGEQRDRRSKPSPSGLPLATSTLTGENEDDLSLILHPNEYIDMHNINISRSQDYPTATLSRKNEVVKFSNSYNTLALDEDNEATSPRSFLQDPNVYFYE